MDQGNPSRLFSRYQQLIEVSRELASTLDLDSLLQHVTRAAIEICLAELSLLFIWNETKQNLSLEAVSNKNQNRLIGLTIPASEVSHQVIHERTALIVHPADEGWSLCSSIGKRTGSAIQTAMLVPLVTQDRLLGLLLVINKIGGQFNEYDRETLQALSSQAAVAIENARLFLQSDLIAELVHELRTPLASISTIAHLLQRPEVPETQKTDMIQTLFQETKRLNDLATGYLDLARLEARKAVFDVVETDIHALIQECCGIVRHRASERGISIHLQLAADIKAVIAADREKIKQVLMNLLTNAIKYNRDGGSIEISTTKRWDDWVIVIQDTGVGIRKEELPYLFQRYYRAGSSEKSVQGTGLGLYISKRIIENHGGVIEVQSQPMTGTSFTIALPAA